MDLASLKREGSTLELTHEGRKIGLTLHLHSPDSPEVRKAGRRFDGRLAMQAMRKGEMSEEEREDLTGENLFEREDARARAAVCGWEWTKDEDGEPGSFGGEQPAFSPEAFDKIVDILPAILDQVSAHLNADILAAKKSKRPSQKPSA